MSVYYNELDPGKAAWLRELIRRDVILLRGYGDAINAEVAKAFIVSAMEVIDGKERNQGARDTIA